jgi:undecaprenyl-diphosphatase
LTLAIATVLPLVVLSRLGPPRNKKEPSAGGTRNAARRTTVLARRAGLAIILFTTMMASPVSADGPFHIDHLVPQDESGIWNPNVYRGLMRALTVGQIGLALYEGGETRLGSTAWRGIDSEIIAAVSTEALKRTFRRARPEDNPDPASFFTCRSNCSFPSGEAAEAASIVTPYMLEYGPDHPAVYLLSIIPLYVGVGRVKAQAHWQSDVIAGWAVGGLAGWYAQQRDQPLLLQLMPHGIFVGLKKSW